MNGKVDEIIKSTKTVSTHNILILAAMSIANDYFEVKNTHESLIDMVERKSEHLASRIASQTWFFIFYIFPAVHVIETIFL